MADESFGQPIALTEDQFQRLLNAYQTGRHEAVAEDQFDKLLAATTSTTVASTLVEALERLANPLGSRLVMTPEQARTNEAVRDVAERLGVSVAKAPIRQAARTGTTLAFPDMPPNTAYARVHTTSGVHELPVSGGQITLPRSVRADDVAGWVEFLDRAGRRVGFAVASA